MKAARKVGDAKKHECAFHHRSQKACFDPLHSKTRVLGLIRSNPFVVLCVFSHPQHRLRTMVPCIPLCPRIYSIIPYELFPKARREGVRERPSTERIN